MNSRWGMLIGLWLLSFQVFATEALFPGDRIMYESEKAAEDYRLTLSSLKKINGFWIADREQFLRVSSVHRTYELTSVYSVEDAWKQLQDKVTQAGMQVVFHCHGLDCGSSNAWANERFNVKQLYGLDRDQHYAVWQKHQGQGSVYWVAYLVQRGNKRIYLQLDQLQTAKPFLVAPSAQALEELWVRQGYLVLEDFSASEGFQLELDYLQNLVAMLSRSGGRKVLLVGHHHGGLTGREALELSTEYASWLMGRLKAQGLRGIDIEVSGVGDLAPEAKASAKSVVVVRR